MCYHVVQYEDYNDADDTYYPKTEEEERHYKSRYRTCSVTLFRHLLADICWHS
jgi:hypothetical protein